MIVSGTKQYYLETSENEGEAMCALWVARTSTIWRHDGVEKRTMSDHGPKMSTVPLETQSLKTHSKMKQPRRILVIDKYNGYGASTFLKGCEYETLASLEIDSFLKSETPASLEYVPFLKPWVQECLTSKLRTLLRHEIEERADFDTLEKMHSSDALDLVSGYVNKRDYKDYVEMPIERGLLDKNAMIAAYNKLYCGFLSALFESSFLEEKDPKTRSNTYKDRFQSTVLTPGVFLSCSSLSGPSNLPTSPKIRRIQSEQQSHEKFVGIENDDVLEENYMTVYVKTINKKTISIRYYGNMIAAVMLEEVERRTMIPRDMTRLVHKGKAINGKKSMKENNIKANETIEMSLRLLGGMEANEHMDTHETEEDREKKRKLDEGKEEKTTKSNDDMAHLKKDIMEALKKSDEKMECYSRKTEEKMNDFSKKADDLLERFMIITNTVGTQIQGMNSSIVKLHETNEKMKEEGENKFNKIDERLMDMEKKILDLDKNMKTEAKTTSMET